MKKAIKISMLLLVMMLTFSLVALCVSASCTGEFVNIAPQATVTGDRGPGNPIDVAEDWINGEGALFWGVWDHFHLVNDGNLRTFCPVTVHNASSVGIRLTFDGPYSLSKVVIHPYGTEGRADTSHVWEVTGGALAKENGYDMKVWLYAGDGSQIAALTYFVEKDKFEINTADYGDVAEIYMYMEDHALAQGIWEVEAWTNETHNWEFQEATLKAKCDAEGTAIVKCSTCGETAEAILPATGHVDKCLGECANGCGLSLNISHSREADKACSPLCSKCGTVQFEGQGHIADGTNPCSNTCVVCGEDVVPNAYDIPKIWSTGTYPPYSYAKHVANPNDPCDTTCYSCKTANAVKAKHVPDPNNPCTVSKCYKCGTDGVFSSTAYGGGDNCPHYRDEDNCGRICDKCNANFKMAFAHEFVDEDGNPYCGGTCKNCGGTWIAEQPHTFSPTSPNTCIDCGWERVVKPCEHVYDADCDNKCNLCNATRYGLRSGGYPGENWHVYTTFCDTTCDDCQAVRTPIHVFSYDCQEICAACGENRVPTATHTYSDVTDVSTGEIIAGTTGCDDVCDVCKETRKAPHNYQYDCSVLCLTCFRRNPDADALHDWDNACDTKCNTCNANRKVTHDYDNDCDTECNICKEIRTVGDHVYDNACDKDCNSCGLTRAVPDHVYDNACDKKCNVCLAERTVGDHTYDNACDVSCNSCNEVRTVGAHSYDNDCDANCNICNAPRTVGDHSYDAGIITTPATETTAGEKTYTCEICGDTYTEPIPVLTPAEKDGLGAGAIVGIAAGSTVVVGAGGFSLFWFVIKKKTWADLIGVFKK